MKKPCSHDDDHDGVMRTSIVPYTVPLGSMNPRCPWQATTVPNSL